MAQRFLNGLATNALQVGTTATAGHVLTADASGNATYQVTTRPQVSSETYIPAALPGTKVANTLYADSGNDSLTYVNSDINKSLQIGQEQWIKVTNVTGVAIANGVPVYITGQSTGIPTVALAQANTYLTSIAIGLTTEAIANNAVGYVTSMGLVRDIDTSAFTAGALVFLSAATAGALTPTMPVHPNFRYRLGVVTVSSLTAGVLLVTPTTALPVVNITVSTTAPASPLLNDLWVDSSG